MKDFALLNVSIVLVLGMSGAMALVCAVMIWLGLAQ